MIANSGRLRYVSESCLGDSFPVLPAMTHSAVEECAFGRPNELSKCRDKIGLDDGVIGLYQYACVCVKEKCICCLSNFRDVLEDHI